MDCAKSARGFGPNLGFWILGVRHSALILLIAGEGRTRGQAMNRKTDPEKFAAGRQLP